MRDAYATPQFRKDLAHIPREIRKRAENLIIALQYDPLAREAGSKKLRGITPAVFRARLGAYRIIYTFTVSLLILHRFCHRKDVYRNL